VLATSSLALVAGKITQGIILGLLLALALLHLFSLSGSTPVFRYQVF